MRTDLKTGGFPVIIENSFQIRSGGNARNREKDPAPAGAEEEETACMKFDFGDGFALFDMTPVDNQFILEYLPAARGDDVRVYLYGLMRCYHPETEMSTERMCQELGLSEEEIARAYRYWERKGLVRRVSDDPVSYQYVSLRQRMLSGDEPQLDPEYEAFVESVYGVFDHGRRLHGGEIRTCYEWVEELKLPPEAVLMLLKHMERIKGKNFSIQSAEQTALQMAQENIRTVEEAEEFLSRDQAAYQGTRAVLKRLGKRNAPSEDQLALYRKWTGEWKFTQDGVLEACVDTAKGDPTMGFLDGILRNIQEDAAPGTQKDGNYVRRVREEGIGLRKVLKALNSRGMTEENLNWFRRVREAYPEEMILLAARECGRKQGSTEDVEKMLDSWKKKGIETQKDAEAYIQKFRTQSELLQELREKWGLRSLSGEGNRQLITEWEEKLGFSAETILTVAEAACGAEKPMLYLNSILQDYAKRGIRTKEQAEEERNKRQAQKPAGDGKKPGKPNAARDYSQRDYAGTEESMDDVLNRLGGGKKPDA